MSHLITEASLAGINKFYYFPLFTDKKIKAHRG